MLHWGHYPDLSQHLKHQVDEEGLVYFTSTVLRVMG
jgi:hypothetical protein